MPGMNRLTMLHALGIPGDVKDWLVRRIPSSEITGVFAECAAARDERAVGFAAHLERLEPGDEVWAFRSPPETWAHLRGRAGFCVLRDQEVVAIYVTMLS